MAAMVLITGLENLDATELIHVFQTCYTFSGKILFLACNQYVSPMSWTAVAHHQPFLSPKKRLGISLLISFLVMIRCLIEFWETGFSTSFTLYAGLAMVAAMLEWKHYHKPRQIQLSLADGKLVYTNECTAEMHTVYQSRTEWIKREGDLLIFYSENSLATRIPLRYFSAAQQFELLSLIHTWNKKLVDHEHR
jgi:hypothetical protein